MTERFASIDEVLNHLYECISGPAGSWRPDEEKTLFWSGAGLCRSGVDESGRPWLNCMTFEEYAADVAPVLASRDFYEHETRRETNRLGNIAQVRSYYEARQQPEDEQPEWRGVNFIQLYHDGSRWWILSMAWDNDRPGIESQNIDL